MHSVTEKARQIRLVIFDVDGVLTDGRLFFDHQGHESKGFHARDGLGIKLLQQTGVEVAVISGRRSRSVEQRMAALDIKHVYQGQDNKVLALDQLCETLGLEYQQITHVGDDVLDIPIMNRVGLSVAVQDAHSLVKEKADWTTTLPGGYGAAREVCDLVMQAQDKLATVLTQYEV
ncbi:MAG: 3-deoxy-manno-octulosonate-8-phosphatase KdsC [Gammaproteobacteria bacterium]|nr:3-deoxy-manno-octulosonate-8-phosphatase KdsC [Gammaproteobacteria bacterium]